MGYTTDFYGEFTLNKPLDKETYDFLDKLNRTRRMARRIVGYGVEGEFFVDGTGDFGQEETGDIIDFNRPPSTQPGLWCQWRPNKEGTAIVWDEGEKFYNYIEWIEYIIDKILAPRGYTLDGEMEWEGEERGDLGRIVIKDNIIDIQGGYTQYKSRK